jgi:hypothetical protein
MEILNQSATPGQNNLNLPASTARIIEGATWKRQRVVTVIPTAKNIDYRAVHSWMNLMYPPNQASYRFPTWMVQGEEVGIAYSESIKQIVQHPDLGNWEFILTLETDNLPPHDGLIKLLRRMEANPQFACIGGLYWTKGGTPDGRFGWEGSGVPQIWGDPFAPDQPNFRPQAPKPGQLVECVGTGMGFNLWRTSMFKDERLRKPWFKTIAGPEGLGTQDLYFWGDARQYGYRCAVDCDVLVGHLDSSTGIVW